MNRYMAKLNAEHLPGNDPSRWEMRVVEVPKSAPRRVREPKRSGIPQISVGDEIWICTDASGPGIAASANVAEVIESESGLGIQLYRSRTIDEPIPLSAFARLQSGSDLLDQLQRNRHPDLYFLDDDIFLEFEKVILDRVGAASLPSQPSWEDVISRNRAEARKQREEIQNTPLSLRPVRQGQKAFRDALIQVYDGKCVVTGCAVRCTLEAAHIMPWTGDPELDRPENGLLLRRDIHALFDAGLIIVDPHSGQLSIDATLMSSTYARLHGSVIDHCAAPELLSERIEILHTQEGLKNERA